MTKRSLGLSRGLIWTLTTAALSSAAGLSCGGGDTTTTGSGGAAGMGATGGMGGAAGAGMGGAGGVGGAAGAGGVSMVCGDGVVTPPELCDDGNDQKGDGCEPDCSFTCTKGTVNGDAKCDDGDPCSGKETCTDAHTCAAGDPLSDGSPCGAGKVCKSGVCGDVTCGDGFVDPGEDCDDGNLDPADGCDSCAFTCVVDADCDPADPCAGIGACAADHTCSTVMPLPDGASCPGGSCLIGVCVVSSCGNGKVEPGELCDDGNIVGGDGCEPTCKLTCGAPATDCPAPPACNKAVCSAANTCATAPDAAQDGQMCGAGLVCNNGACLGAGATCGNGTVETGEDCDFGAGNGPGTGCETICKFSCTKMPDSCPDQNACNGVEACNTVVVGGKIGQRCSMGSSLPMCAKCGAGLCSSGVCVPSSCGDGCTDVGAGESCDPPNMTNCDAACHSHICGNGVREAGEECDDGNTGNLDGCASDCKFEQLQRIRYLVLQYASDALCQSNQLGAAVVGQTAQSQLQTSINDGLQAGAIDILLQFLSLDDLTGTADPSLQLGTMNGLPKKLGQPYDGTNDLDFWHTPDPMSLDPNKVPLAQLPASISSKTLTAGPGALTLTVSFGGPPAPLSLSAVKLAITVGSATTPLTSAGNVPPGHVTAEHLNPALMSFATAGQPNANGAGKLCGNISAQSLAAVPIPTQLTTGLFACAEGYTLTNTMLDVIVGGCTVLNTSQIAAKQPDQVDPAAPPAGAGAPYTLTTSAQNAVTGCLDKNGMQAPLAACLNAAAYSSFFKVAMNRVIAK